MLPTLCSICYRRLLAPYRGCPKPVISAVATFWSPGPGDEYVSQKKKTRHPYREAVNYGIKEMKDLPGEFGKYAEEVKDKFTGTPIFYAKHDSYEVLYKFDDKDTIGNWLLSSDSDMGVGKSHGEFVLSQNKTGVFRGFLNTEPVKDGVIKNAGYCNIRSPTKRISFKRARPHDLSLYSHLLLRVRGDGRPYQIMLSMDRYFDIQWNDQYTYTLFTRGGPYWQWAKIPFSKFFLTSKGRIQDAQEKVQLDKIQTIGLTAADGYTGPFNLEIDFVAALMDYGHSEDFAYELYETGGSCMM